MSESNIEKSQAQTAYELGNLVGRHQALGLIASRCSAADAATLRHIRDQELWRGEAKTWNEFCETRLKMTRTHANRLIKLLEEFGPAYFQISHATRVSTDDYRKAIAPAVRDNTLHVNGETIALIEENDPRIAAAVHELRQTVVVKAIPAPAEAAPVNPFLVLERRCADLMAEFAAAADAVAGQASGRTTLESILLMLQSRLSRLEREMMAARRRSNGK